MKKRPCSLVQLRGIFARAALCSVSVGWFSFVSATLTEAAPAPVRPEAPITFFTNIATHLLRAQLNLDLARIQLYPSNQYSSAVHRVLQIAANLYDSTTNRALTTYPYLPSVFRPLFTNDNGDIYIAGYAEVTSTDVLGARMRDLEDPDDRAVLQTEDMVRGVPIVVGAKKGYPGFNELAMETTIQVARRLQFRRASLSGPPNETNQMFIVGISNVLGVEAWNPFTNSFPRELQLSMCADVTAILTNELGSILVSNRFTFPATLNIASNSWAGFLNPLHTQASMKVPLLTNFMMIPNATYSEALGGFVPLTGVFERDAGRPFPVPHWWLRVNTGLRFVLIDTSADRIVDYVNLSSEGEAIDISYTLMQGGECSATYLPPNPLPDGALWCTNRGDLSGLSPPFGIRNQIVLGLGLINGHYADFIHEGPPGIDLRLGIDFFRWNLLGSRFQSGSVPLYLTNVFYAPFSPIRNIYYLTSWQANDPLVHYTVGDLMALPADRRMVLQRRSSTIVNIGQINKRYEPWAGLNSFPTFSRTTYDIRVKDPLVWRADDWDFPSGEPLRVESLGRIHRGTPWQTIYLKAPAVDPGTWWNWVGFMDAAAAVQMHPTNDWRLVSALIPLLVKEHPHKLVSVNQATTLDWEAVLKGLDVLTNTLSDDQLHLLTAPDFDSLKIHSKAPQIGTVIADLSATRASQASGIWADRADILATPALSINSPWLNQSPIQFQRGVTDEAYEKIPSQILQLLRSDSIGSIKQLRQDLKVQFKGMAGYAFAVETSSDLVKWTAVSTNYSIDGIIEFSDKLPGRGHSRFFRSVLLPPDESKYESAEGKP